MKGVSNHKPHYASHPDASRLPRQGTAPGHSGIFKWQCQMCYGQPLSPLISCFCCPGKDALDREEMLNDLL